MKLFLVKRKMKIGYDEYDSCVIIAPDEETIHDMLSKDRSFWKEQFGIDESTQHYWDCGKDDREIIEIDLNQIEKPIILVSSYNAG